MSTSRLQLITDLIVTTSTAVMLAFSQLPTLTKLDVIAAQGPTLRLAMFMFATIEIAYIRTPKIVDRPTLTMFVMCWISDKNM